MERIIVQKSKEKVSVEILPISYPPKNFVMLVWLTLWSICGAMVLYQLYIASDKNTKIICIIYMGFWSYFEFLIIRIYRWRKFGKEIIELENKNLILTRSVKGKGIPARFSLLDITNIHIDINEKGTMFGKLLFDEYWTAGAESIKFYNKKTQHGFGLQLTEKEAKQVLKALNI